MGDRVGRKEAGLINAGRKRVEWGKDRNERIRETGRWRERPGHLELKLEVGTLGKEEGVGSRGKWDKII